MVKSEVRRIGQEAARNNGGNRERARHVGEEGAPPERRRGKKGREIRIRKALGKGKVWC